MKQYYKYYYIAVFVFFILTPLFTQAQTPGFIYSPATAGGAKVLDPNGDGYVSRTASGFTGTSDEGVSFSEIPYRPFPALLVEPLGDLNTGSTGGHTDFAPPATPNTAPSTGSPVTAFFDGVNLMFRIRLGNSSTASKGYGVLIDSDQNFSGPDANPGFEYEVLLASNFAVQVINHGASGSPVVFSGAADQYAQKAVAASTAGGTTDYFYDYYVPLTAFNGGITAATPLRMSGITITSAQSGLTGTVSDVGGVNFQAYNYSAPAAWRALIGAFPATSLSTLQTSGFAPVAAVAPAVSGPVTVGSTTITGTSVEAAGSTVNVYRTAANGTQTSIGTTTVSSNGSWSLTGLATTLLTAGDKITATVTAPNKSASPASNALTVTQPAVCTATPAPTITGQSNSSIKYLVGTTPYVGRQVITIYSVNPATSVQVYNREGSYVFTSTSAGQALPTTATGLTVLDGTVTLTKTGNYVATVTPVNASNAAIGCESLKSNQLCYQNGGTGPVNNYKPTITNVTSGAGIVYNTLSDIPTSVASITGTLSSYAAGSKVYLYKNGIYQPAYTGIPSATAPFTWTITGLSGLSLSPGDVLTVRTEASLSCGLSLSAASNFATAKETTATPVINQIKACGPVKAVSGTSTEPGSVVTIYTNGTSTGLTAVANANGVWAVDLSSLNSGAGVAPGVAITARAKTAGKATSLISNTVQSSPAPAGVLAVTSPIAEGSTSVAGTGPTGAAGAKVTLYIEGTPFPAPVLIAPDGTWKVTGISSQELFAGASVTATFTPTDGCESAKSTPVTVICKAPVATYTLAPATATICGGGTASVTLSGSEYGISYRLLVNGAESGGSVLGTGGPITLTSGPVSNLTTANTTASLTYRARKISGTTCDAMSTNTAAVTVRPQPGTTGLTFTNATQSVCANSSVTYSLSGTNVNYNYQLVNEATNELVGSPVQGVSTGAISLSSGPVRTNTAFGLRVTIRSAEPSPCGITLPSLAVANISSPSTTRAVFADNSKTCVGGATRINVSTEPNNDFEYRVYRRVGATPNTSTDPLLGTFRGNGTVQSVTTGPLSTAGTATFYVTVTRMVNNTCGTLTLQNTAQVEVTNGATPANAGADRTVCGNSAVLSGNDVSPGIGTWSRVSGPSSVTFSSPNSSTATVQGLVSGTYVFQWTVQTTCGGTSTSTSDDVTIKVNCDAAYTIAVPKYKDKYIKGEVIASATDPDGAITAAGITQGSVPPGVAFNTATGAFTVQAPSDLVEGTYGLSVRLVDAQGGVTLTAITLRIYGMSPTIVPLPVELVYFTATVQNGIVNLQWLTASERNNKGFVVERSADGELFEPIGTVQGNGNSSQPVRYSYADGTPLDGTAYYRLKQVDTDGAFAYSSVIAVGAAGIAADMQLQVYPNPFSTELNITATAQKRGSASLQLYDVQGRLVHTGSVELRPGLNELVLPLRFVRNGMYILRLTGDGINGSVKVLRN